MAFIVEDGEGVLGATSYTTVQFFRDYHTDRGVTGVDVGTIADAAVQALLIKATDYLNLRFGQRLRGQISLSSLASRSVLTFTAQPINDETIVLAGVTYTFKTTLTVPAVDTEIEIGANLLLTINNTISAVAASTSTSTDIVALKSNGVDTIHIFTSRDGVTTTETSATASFDVAASIGFSASRQPQLFPRKNLFHPDTGLLIIGVPTEVQQATAEYALRANTAALLPDPTVDASGLKVTGSKVKVGPIETSTDFSESVSASAIKPYPAADLLMSQFILAGGTTVRA